MWCSIKINRKKEMGSVCLRESRKRAAASVRRGGGPQCCSKVKTPEVTEFTSTGVSLVITDLLGWYGDGTYIGNILPQQENEERCQPSIRYSPIYQQDFLLCGKQMSV